MTTPLEGITQLRVHWPGVSNEGPPDARTWRYAGAALESLRPQIRAFGKRPGIGGYEGAAAHLNIAPPGHEGVGRAWQGIAAGRRCIVVQLTFSRSDAFLSTDRAARPAPLRLPVSDRYEALLEIPEAIANNLSSVTADNPFLSSPLILREHRAVLRLTPFGAALNAMERLQASPRFQALLAEFGTVAFGTRLELAAPTLKIGVPEQNAGMTLGRHLLSRLATHLPTRLRDPLAHRLDLLPQEELGYLPAASVFPPRQLKFYLDQWLPKGDYRLDALFPDVARMPEEALQLESDAMAFTVEFIEGTTPRHVQQRFRGTWVHAVVTQERVAAWEERRI